MATEATKRTPGPRLEVTYRSLGRSGRIWNAAFECGSEDENRLQALRVARLHRAAIVKAEG